MHVLVTGAAGFIGSHVSEALRGGGTGSRASTTSTSCLSLPETRGRGRDRGCGVHLVEGDICEPLRWRGALDDSVDVVVHLAALAGVRTSLAQPLRYIRTNVEGTGVIIERMRELGKQRLVFASSSSVYGAKHAGRSPRSARTIRV